MPSAQEQRSFGFPGYQFNDQSAAVDFESSLAFTKTVPAILAAQTGTLTTRTDDDTGVATLSTGHGIETGDVVDVYFAAGVRYGMDATVATNAVTVDGGAGDALPTQDDAVTVVLQLDWEINFDGDDAQIIGVLYRNSSDTGAKGSLDLQDTDSASIEALDLVHETANGGLDNITNISAGDTNVYAGNRITVGKITHDSLSAATAYVLVGLVSA